MSIGGSTRLAPVHSRRSWINWRRAAPSEHQALLRSLLAGRDADKIERIRNLIIPSGSIEYARNRARKLVERAQQSISPLPDSEAKAVLQTMAKFVISRPL